MLRERKPAGPTKRARRRKSRIDSRYAGNVRAICADRDGFCRVAREPNACSRFGLCGGVSEWAHLGEKKRFKTRGLPPEERHTTADSLMLCTRHHDAYDEYHTLRISGDADSDLTFERVD